MLNLRGIKILGLMLVINSALSNGRKLSQVILQRYLQKLKSIYKPKIYEELKVRGILKKLRRV